MPSEHHVSLVCVLGATLNYVPLEYRCPIKINIRKNKAISFPTLVL